MKKIKNQKGAVTLIVLVTMLFLTAFLLSTYMIVSSRLHTQDELTEHIKQTYDESENVNEIYSGLISGERILRTIKVGDYVSYTPDTGTYKVADGEYGSGYTTEEGYQSFTTETGDSSLQWRILSINEETGEVELVSATEGQVLYLEGVDGYNHGVDILNDLCETLYSKTINGEKVATARSMNIEDINAKTTYDYTTYSYETFKYNDEIPYSDYATMNKKYPNLYAKEDGFYIAGEKQTGGISGSIGLEDGEINADGVTEYKTVTGYTDDNVAETKKDVSVTFSYYDYIVESYLDTNLGINAAPGGLIDIDKDYLLASRCVGATSAVARFRLNYVRTDGWIAYKTLIYSDRYH